MTLYRSDLTPDDRRFVIATWSSSYKSAHAAGLIMDEDWPDVMHIQLGKLIDRPTTTTIVAYDLPSEYYGFICGDVTGRLPIVHYCYVKGGYRAVRLPGDRWSGPRHARGLFRALGVDPGAPFLFSCKTPIVSQLTHKIPRGRFVPAAGRYANYNHRQERDHE